MGFLTEGHHRPGASWSSGSCSEPIRHLLHVQKLGKTVSVLCHSFWPALSPGEVADPQVGISSLLQGDKLCASPGITLMGGDIVPSRYGSCSAQELWLPVTTFSRLGREEDAGLGRDHSLQGQVLGVLQGYPSPGEPLTTLRISLPCRAIEKLSDHQFENYSFKISYIPDEEVSSPPPPQRSRRGGHSSRERGSSPGGSSQPKQLDFPLRMLVPTQFVGAIIGKEGLTIKNLTKQTQSK